MIYESDISLKIGKYRVNDWDRVEIITEQAKELKIELISLLRDSIEALKDGKMARGKALISVVPHVIEMMEKEIEVARRKLESTEPPLKEGEENYSLEVKI